VPFLQPASHRPAQALLGGVVIRYHRADEQAGSAWAPVELFVQSETGQWRMNESGANLDVQRRLEGQQGGELSVTVIHHRVVEVRHTMQ
jgi:hypothetical protein